MDALVCEKVQQAIGILDELGIDAWLTFVRETTESGDTALPIILDHHLTWQSALILTRDRRRIAIVGNFEADTVRGVGAWNDVRPYVQGISQPLREALGEIDPKSLAVNYSTDDVKADGLSHGMWLLLQEHLKRTPFVQRLRSADHIIAALRGRKSATELERIRAAVRSTEEIFAETGRFLRVGRSEKEIADFMKDQARRRGLGLAWEEAGCPIVNVGPESSVGHSVPSEHIRIEPGHLVHIDFGVRQDGFCSDLQRCWYVPQAGESGPPAAARAAFDATVAAINAAAGALRPGVAGWEVDAAARSTLMQRGFPEYQHATGHHLGRAAHDGCGVLGPRWERYGRTPYARAEANNVFTLELGVYENGPHGAIGLEEDVVVTGAGVEWLSAPQRELGIVKPA
jgi:Xaa-Pro aminopeptidase